MAADEKKMPSEAEKKFIDAIVRGKLIIFKCEIFLYNM